MSSKKIKDMFFIGIFLFIFLEFFHPISAFTQDLGRHLLLGKIIWTTHQVPKTNLFSYTYPHFPFINTHWGAEVVFYLITQVFGTQGLLFIMACIAALSVVILLFSLPKYLILNTKYWIPLLIVLLYSGILLERTDLRPEIFSFLFTAIFMAILWKNREKSTKWLLLLPVIELLWVNMHIYFVIGPLLIGLFLVDALFLKKIDWKLAIILGLTCLAMLINPSGIQGALYPFTVFHNYGYTIEENQSIFFLLSYGIRSWSYLFFGVGAGGVFLLLLTNFKRSRPIDWLLALVFTYIAASSIRNLPLFVFATVPTCVCLLQQTTSTLHISPTTRKAIYIVVGLLLLFNLHLFISQNSAGYGITTGAEKATDFFLAHHLKGPIFNNFDIGSYLDYRLYPKQTVFVDGRPEAYPVSFFQNTYIPMQQDPAIFAAVDKTYHFQSIFFSYTDQTPWAQQFLQHLMQNNEWQLVYLDTFSAIWVKKGGVNDRVTNIDAVTSQNFSLDSITTTIPQDYLHLLYFFSLAGWDQPELLTAQKIAALDPHNCPALGILTNTPSTAPFYISTYKENCR